MSKKGIMKNFKAITIASDSSLNFTLNDVDGKFLRIIPQLD